MNIADVEYSKLLGQIHGVYADVGRVTRDRSDRTGTGTSSAFGRSLTFDLTQGFPILEGKTVHWKSVVHELLWFISGDTRVSNLKDKGVRIWDEWVKEDGTIGPGYGAGWRNWYDPLMGNVGIIPRLEVDEWADVEVSDEPFEVPTVIKNLYSIIQLPPSASAEPIPVSPVWDSVYKFARTIQLVPGYHQYMSNRVTDYPGEWSHDEIFLFIPDYFHNEFLSPATAAFITHGRFMNSQPSIPVSIDQLAEAIDMIKTDPTSRRIVVSAWNPAQIHNMALPPCHMFYQFYVDGDYLDMQMYQRSADMFLGVPFNISSYALLLSMVAQVTGKVARDLHMVFGDAHIYDNHKDQVNEYLDRIDTITTDGFNTVSLELNPEIKNIDDFKFEDITINNYKPLGPIKAPVAV